MAHSVALSWVASPDAVDGYNVYRGKAGAETTLINTSPVTALNFTDSSPAIGVNDYIVKAVKNGVEAVASNEVATTILPSPATALTVTSAS